jgi:uncharacterized RDD family membrane protein YckC
METNITVEQNAPVKCSECGGTFSLDDVIHHGRAFICAGCKPIFIQKLSEGATIDRPKFHYGGFGRRFLASLIDSVILYVLNFAIQLIGLPLGLLGAVLPLLAGVAYYTLLVGAYGTTVGKTVCQMRVVMSDGGRVSYLKALARYFASLLSWMTLGIGYLMVAFDSEKRGLHDHICGTRVIIG